MVEVSVSDPKVYKGSSLKSYTFFTVKSKGGDFGTGVSVERRFSDFTWLQEAISANLNFRGCLIPPMPAKEKTSSDFMEKRMASLELFLGRCLNGSVASAPELFHFLKVCLF